MYDSLSMDVSWMKFVDRWGGCTTVDEGLVNGDRDHDCKLLLKLAFVRLFQQDFQKKILTTNEVIYFTAMEIGSENVCLVF